MNSSDDYEKLTFEEAMNELESVVSRLDSGEGTLDESISLFQKGVALSKLCSKRLEDIEKRVKMLTEDGSEMKREIDFPESDLPETEK